MKTLLFTSILLLLCAGTLVAFTGIDETNNFFTGSEMRQQAAVPLNPSILRSGETITLTWDAVTEDVNGNPISNISYKVYWGDTPDFECGEGSLIQTVTVPTLILGDDTGNLDRAFFKIVAVEIESAPSGDFVLVPGGTFTMGRINDEYVLDTVPLHSVTLDSFYMGKYEITQAEYIAIMGTWESDPIGWGTFGIGNDYPVYYVNWYSAVKYCNLRSMAEGLSPCYTIAGSTDPADWGEEPGKPLSKNQNLVWDAAICDWTANGYRLPTEAEWEYAARGASNNPDYLYSGSNNINDVSWYGENSGNTTHIVGTKAPNALDLYDMSGNLWELCWDWYEGAYYSISPSIHPTGPDSGQSRVHRGGGWNGLAEKSQVSNRDYDVPYVVLPFFGFRVCKSAGSLQQCVQPGFNPPAGSYTDAQSVEISTTTIDANIRYTTDGSEPSQTNGELYTAPIDVSETTIIKAIAYMDGQANSAIATAVYIIGTSVPEDFVLVPGGTYVMGRDLIPWDTSTVPLHSVTLDSFYMCKYEITQAEYEAIMGPWDSDAYGWGTFGVGDDYPVYYVNWYSALKYCNLRSMAEGFTPCYAIEGSTDPADWGAVPVYAGDGSGQSDPIWDAATCDWTANGYRLPTEAEWEYAARGATNNPDYLYSGSDNINDVAWYGDNSGDTTHIVGSKAPNALGFYDMSGNIMEWCWDWHSSSYYSSSPDNNPTGPPGGNYGDVRLLRGSSWDGLEVLCQVSYRLSYYPYRGSHNIGFRICRPALAQQCAQPGFNPYGGVYLAPQNVEISTATMGASIRYTTDGSEPSQTNGELYTQPIDVSETTTIKAIAYKDGYTDSELASASYMISASPEEHFVYIPAGTFSMGDSSPSGNPEASPAHSVSLRAYHIAKYELNQAAYEDIMGSNPAVGNGVGDMYPVYQVSWYDALKYCNLRSMEEELTPAYSIAGSTDPADWGDLPGSDNPTWDAVICDWNAGGYRLPTEAEWEYAARAITNDPNYTYAGSYDIDDVAWYSGNDTPPGSKLIATKAHNDLDIYDMSGNVAEWCWDWYGDYSADAQSYPTGPESGSYRVSRGGNWGSEESNCRVTSRLGYGPGSTSANGIRLCKTEPLEQCENPGFNPPGGTYEGTQSVVISTTTANASIRYTIDGSEPSQSQGTLYAGPITITESTVVKAIAYKDECLDSELVTAEFTINPVPPAGFEYVPAGTFTMGQNAETTIETPPHSVTLDSFFMAKYEVTQAQYIAIMGSWDYDPNDNDWEPIGIGDNHPVYRVDWYSAIKYCNLRSMEEGLTPCYTIDESTDPDDWGAVPYDNWDDTWDAAICDWTANGYRLPTEAEWEYAARGATDDPDYIYSGSDNIDDVAWYEDNSGDTTHIVGTKAPNALDLYDMSGNVEEWCWDCFGYEYYSESPSNNPTGPASGGASRVERGGECLDMAQFCRVAARERSYPYWSCAGIRVCRSGL